MAAQPHGYAGLDYLAKATDFLIACRLEDPLGGLWDAADIQWWWREDDFRDPAHQLFFETPDGAPRAMLLLSPTYGTFDYELMPGEEDTDLGQQVLRTGMTWLEEQRSPTSRQYFFLKADHHALRRRAEAHGYRPMPDALVQTSQTLPSILERAPLPDGYAVRPIQHDDIIDGRQPVLTTPAGGIERLGHTSLYDPRHHLVVTDEDDHAVAECIYWTEPTTRIGLIEPVATHPAHRRRGLARAMLTRALQDMTRQGTTIAKVCYASSNLPAATLYRTIGLHPHSELLRYTR